MGKKNSNARFWTKQTIVVVSAIAFVAIVPAIFLRAYWWNLLKQSFSDAFVLVFEKQWASVFIFLGLWAYGIGSANREKWWVDRTKFWKGVFSEIRTAVVAAKPPFFAFAIVLLIHLLVISPYKANTELVARAAKVEETKSIQAIDKKARKQVKDVAEELKTTSGKTPGRLPVSSVAAYVTLHLGTNTVRSEGKWSDRWSGLLTLMGGTVTDKPMLSSSVMLTMVSDRLEWWGPHENLSIPLEFRLAPGDMGITQSIFERPADEVLQDLKFFQLRPAFLYDNTPVRGGTIKLVLNGGVTKTFEIPIQTYFWGRTNSAGQMVSNLMINNIPSPIP